MAENEFSTEVETGSAGTGGESSIRCVEKKIAQQKGVENTKKRDAELREIDNQILAEKQNSLRIRLLRMKKKKEKVREQAKINESSDEHYGGIASEMPCMSKNQRWT